MIITYPCFQVVKQEILDDEDSLAYSKGVFLNQRLEEKVLLISDKVMNIIDMYAKS